MEPLTDRIAVNVKTLHVPANLVLQQCASGTTRDTTYSVYAHGIAPASTYSHIVDVVLDSLPRAQNVQVVADPLPLAPVPLYVVPCPVPRARLDYVVSTAVPCNNSSAGHGIGGVRYTLPCTRSLYSWYRVHYHLTSMG